MEWIAYAQLEPFGPLDDSRRAGVLASILANAHRNPKRTQPFRPDQFFPELTRASSGTQSIEQQKAMARHITALFQQAEALKRDPAN